MSDEKQNISFKRQVILVAFGAAVGFFPVAFNSTLQSFQQREQFLLDRRLTALKDFASTAKTGASLLGRLTAFEQRLDDIEKELRPGKATVVLLNQVRQLNSEAWELNTDMYVWVSELNVQTTILGALLGIQLPQAKYPADIAMSAEDTTSAELTSSQDLLSRSLDNIKKAKQNVKTTRQHIISTIHHIQESSGSIASQF